MSEQNVATRLKLFLEAEGLSNSQFADTCGIPRPTLSQLLSGRNKKISDVLVGQIHAAYPKLSVVWLLFGEGQMMGGEPEREARQISFTDDNDSESDSDAFFPSDEEEFPATPRVQSKYGEDFGVKNGLNASQTSDSQLFDAQKKIADLELQIAQIRNHPRKVVQITVYYDDNTFETFLPGSK